MGTPHNTVDLLMQGAGILGQGLSAREDRLTAEREAKAPINPALQRYIQALMEPGADPVAIGAAARNDPEVQGLMATMRGGSAQPQQAPSFPDIGMQNGRPQMAMPGTFDPTRQPQSLGATPQMPQAQPQAPQPQPQQQYTYQPSPRGDAEMTQSAPGQMPAQQSLGQIPAQAAPRPQMAAPPPRPQPAPFPTISRQEYATQFAPILPTLAAAQGRKSTAEVAAQAKNEAGQRQTNTQLLIAQMREQGLDSRHAGDLAAKFAGLDISQQQAVLRGEVTLEGLRISGETARATANIGARSREKTTGMLVEGRQTTAETEAGSGDREELNKELLQAMKGLDGSKVPGWQKDEQAVAIVKGHQARVDELRRALGRPTGGMDSAPAPTRKSAPKAAPKAKALSQKDKQALEWAQKNPNDPNAIKILKHHGR